MTNIRIEADNPLPAPGEFEDYGPDEVRGLLAEAGVFRRHPRVVFLSGYCGGQVNAATGDFVFNCKAIYELSETGSSFHKPAIFSGSMFGALNAVREAFGPLRLDATGYCGKWGQSVLPAAAVTTSSSWTPTRGFAWAAADGSTHRSDQRRRRATPGRAAQFAIRRSDRSAPGRSMPANPADLSWGSRTRRQETHTRRSPSPSPAAPAT